MKERIEIIKDFAKKMGYEIYEEQYIGCDDGRPCYSIELIGTSDNEGYPYGWGWYLDTEEEIL